MNGQRARDPEEKALRRGELLAAAARLLDERGLGEITIAEVARSAGLAKGTVYLYFRTKEELFAELLVAELDSWANPLAKELGRAARGRQAERIARSMAARPRLVRLLGLLHGPLEENIDGEAALRLKEQLLAVVLRLGATVEERARLRPGAGARFLLRLHAAAVGLGQMSSPSAPVRAVLERHPELALLQIDFHSELAAIARALIAIEPRGGHT